MLFYNHDIKQVQRSPVSCSWEAPDKINRGDKSTVTCDSSKISTFVPQEYQIRMCSDEFD